MGLTFRKRDDFDKMMDDLGVSTVDLVIDENKTTSSTDKKDDPFAKFLNPKSDEGEKEKNELKS
ncbi:MAG: hypothetical protein FWH31_08390 [Streptococcaceae bacterium]|nr:hypothetical protein [Streptococcaceae bacterium]